MSKELSSRVNFRRKYNRTSIQLSFPENGHIGCDNHCSFCIYNKCDYNIPLCPTEQELTNLFNITEPGGTILLCGSGDPLYHIEKNQDKLIPLINIIKKNGFKVQIVTKYYSVVKQYGNSLLKDVDCYVFSTEVLDNNLRELINLLTSNNIPVRLGKIYNYTASLESVNKDFIINYINFYSQIKNISLLKISLRANYNYPESSDQGLRQEQEWVIKNTPPNSCFTYLHGTRAIMPVLGGNEIIRCCDSYDKVEEELNIKIKDLL